MQKDLFDATLTSYRQPSQTIIRQNMTSREMNVNKSFDLNHHQNLQNNQKS